MTHFGNSKNDPIISLFTKYLYVSVGGGNDWFVSHLSPWNPLSFRVLVCVHNIFFAQSVTPIDAVLISVNQGCENQKLLQKKNWFGRFSLQGSCCLDKPGIWISTYSSFKRGKDHHICCCEKVAIERNHLYQLSPKMLTSLIVRKYEISKLKETMPSLLEVY